MSLNNLVKRLQDIMRNDAGINGDAQRIEQMVWILFLKVYDAKEEIWEFYDENYTSIIPEELRWRNWAVDHKDGKALTGDALLDFVNGKLSYDLPKTSYAPGLISSPLHFWLPSHVSHRLREGFKDFGRKSRGFLTNEAVVIAVETRTSSPIRILRDTERLMHVRIKGLFPCGEGAGYAGGIVSAGVDGERCAEMCAEYLVSRR